MSKAKNKEAAVEETVERHGMVVWTDGGARPTNPGPAGWGIHGYMFNAVKPKKGSGNADHLLTTHGYVLKVNADRINQGEYSDKHWENVLEGKGKPLEITPVHYVDGYGSFTQHESNNVAELVASTRALEYARDYDLKLVQVYTDSKYVQEGITQWIGGWERNNWTKRDGTEVANSYHWKNLQNARQQLENRGVKVTFSWIKGHNDHLGNERADLMATVGAVTSKEILDDPENSHALHQVTTSVPEGYWKYESSKHPFISHRRMYFNTDPQYVKPGEYFLGDHGKDDELLGKRIATGAYAVVRLRTPDPVLEMIRERQMEYSRGANTVVMARLDEAFSPDTHKVLSEYGRLALERSPQARVEKLIDMQTITRRPITRELNPARLAHRAAESLGDLDAILKLYLEKDPAVCVTDLTSILYEQSVKTKPVKKGEPPAEPKQIFTLRSKYNVGFASLPVDAQYHSSEGVVKTAQVILVLGIDLVDRNALKRMEEHLPKVSLVTWMETEKVFRYATIIEAGEDVGIWAGYYSNTRVLSS